MPRRRKLPPDIDPKRPHCAPSRKPKHECGHCHGFTRAVKGQTLEQAIVNHEATCPALLRIKPTPKKGR